MESPLSLIMVVLRASWADRIADHCEGLGCAPARPTGLAQPIEEEEEEEEEREREGERREHNPYLVYASELPVISC